MRRLLPFLALLAACGPTPPSQQSTEQTYDTANRIAEARAADTARVGQAAAQHRTGTVCYAGAVGADSIKLTLVHAGPSVRGELAYLPAEKDRSRGTLTGGMLHGDTLLAHYNFQSEGTTSVRQVAFLLKGDSAIEGYGDVTDRDGRQVFKDWHTLRFGAGYKAVRTTCPR